MGEFALLDDDMQEALDDAYGERVRVEPMVVLQTWRGQPQPDDTREVREIVGRHRATPVQGELEGNREGSKFQSMTRITGAGLTLRVSPAQLIELGYDIRPGDRVVLLDRIDLPGFTVGSAAPRDSGEFQITLIAGLRGEA